jgi:hypothetical protein
MKWRWASLHLAFSVFAAVVFKGAEDPGSECLAGHDWPSRLTDDT